MNTGSIVGISAGVLVALLGGSVLCPKIFAAFPTSAAANEKADALTAQQAKQIYQDADASARALAVSLQQQQQAFRKKRRQMTARKEQVKRTTKAVKRAITVGKAWKKNKDNPNLTQRFKTEYDAAESEIQKVNKLIRNTQIVIPGKKELISKIDELYGLYDPQKIKV